MPDEDSESAAFRRKREHRDVAEHLVHRRIARRIAYGKLEPGQGMPVSASMSEQLDGFNGDVRRIQVGKNEDIGLAGDV